MSALLSAIKARPAGAAVLGGGIALLIVLATVLILFLFADQTADIQEELSQLAVARSEIAEAPQIEARLKEALRRASNAPGLLHAQNAALGASAIETDFKRLVAANGGEVGSAQLLPAAKPGNYEVLAVEFDFTVPMSHLKDLLFTVETNNPYLFVDDMEISAPGGEEPVSGASADKKLNIRWTLRAYRWTGRT